ncbi:MAG: Ig-like domain-containing protein, partial [Thermoleophilia bacterium]
MNLDYLKDRMTAASAGLVHHFFLILLLVALLIGAIMAFAVSRHDEQARDLSLKWTGEKGYDSDGVDPDFGAAGEYRFRVDYFDSQNNEPTNIQVWVDTNDDGEYQLDEKFPLNSNDPGDSDFRDGARYATNLDLSHSGDGQLSYRFFASSDKDEAVGEPIETRLVTVTGGAPLLTWTVEPGYIVDGVNPDSGPAGDFVFRVDYRESANEAPTAIQVWIDSDDNGRFSAQEQYSLAPTDLFDIDMADGKRYSRTLPLSYAGDGKLSYRFYANDGVDSAEGAPTAERTVTITRDDGASAWIPYGAAGTGTGNYVSSAGQDYSGGSPESGGGQDEPGGGTLPDEPDVQDTTRPSSLVSTPQNGSMINGGAADPYIVRGTASDNVAVQRVEISTDGGYSWSLADCTGCSGSGVNWTFDWTLPVDGSFGVISRAIDIAGNVEAPVAGNSVLVDRTPPLSVTEPLVEALSATAIDLSWTPTEDTGGSGLAGYRVERAADSGGSPSEFNQFAVTADNSYADVSLSANSMYWYRLKAFDAAGNESHYCTCVFGYTLPTAPNLTADKTTSTWYATADVTFTNIAGFGPGRVQYYRYSWDQTPTHSFTDTETQWSSGTLTKTSLVTGSWYLHVKSYNSEGASNGTVDYDGVAPTGLANQAPLNGAVDQATSVSVESGTATDSDSGQIQYYFEVARDSGFTTGLQASGWQSGTGFAPSLDNATTYYWHVKARDGVLNETSYTATWSFTTTDVPPAAPTIGTPTVLSATSIRWNFTDNAGNETGFRVHDALHVVMAEAAGPDLGYLDETGLTANTQYTRHIHAYNAIGDSTGSGEAYIYTLPTAPNLTADKTTATWYATADVTFTNIAGFGPGGVQYYRYSWDQTPTHSFTDTETQWSSGTLTRTSLVTGSWYLHVKSYNSEGAANGTVDYGPYNYDGVAPTTALLDPADGTTGVSLGTDLTLTVADTASGVDFGTFSVQITGNKGYSRSYTDEDAEVTKTGTSTSYDVTIDPDADFAEEETVTIGVSVNDVVGNPLTPPAWSFTTALLPPAAPSIGTPTVLSTTSIRWNFTDNAGNETGFKVHDALDNIKASSASPDLSFLDEAELAANTSYTRHVHAYNGAGDSVASSSASIYTLPAAPSLTADKTTSTWYATADVTFTNIADFGPGGVEYYRYSWDQTPTHSFTDTETQWSSGTLVQTANLNGSWYLHVKSYNADDAAGSTVDYGPYNYDGSAPSVTSFTATTPSSSLNIPIESFAATDNIAVTGYQITTSPTAPPAGDSGWEGAAQANYTVAADGTYTLYPWAKDAAGNVSSVFDTPRTVVVDTTPPSVDSTVPGNGATAVGLNSSVSVNFSEDVDCSTVNTTNITISSGGWALSSCSGDDAVFSTSGQSNNTVYTVTVSTAVTDANGNPMDSSHQFSYTTEMAGEGITVCATGCDYGMIQPAIDAASDGDTISVYEGTYSENINFLGKDITVQSVDDDDNPVIQGTGANSPVVTFSSGETSSAVLDGFTIDNQAGAGSLSRGISITGGSYPTISGCTIQDNEVISTWVNGAGVYLSGATAVITDTTFHENSGSSGGAIYGTALTAPLSISNSSFTSNTARNGGAVYIASSVQQTVITGSTFSGNSATTQNGGAIYGNASSIAISGSTVSGNTSAQDGAGICMNGSSAALTVYNGSHIDSNSGRYGGGIYGWTGSVISISDSSVDSNTSMSGGAIYLNATAGTSTFVDTSISGNSATDAHGGGIYSNSALSLGGCSIDSNSSALDGAGIYLVGASAAASVTGGTVNSNTGRYGGGIYQGAGASLAVTDASINGNSAISGIGSGGGIYAVGTTLDVDGTNIRGNRSSVYGGGIYNSGTIVTITNSMIAGNISDQQTYSDGGGIYSAGTLDVINSTIAGNYAQHFGGGIRIDSGTATVGNSIIWGNSSGGAGNQISGAPTVSYTDVQGGYSGSGNIDADPLFVDFQQAIAGNPTTQGDFHILEGSPCRNWASNPDAPADDIDGDIRPQEGFADMGADEFIADPGTPAAPSIGTPAALSAASIRWNFTDNAGNEDGFRVHDSADSIKASSASPDLSFLDEAGLAANTSYTRHLHSYNDGEESTASASETAYTLPTAPNLTADKTVSTWYATTDVTFTNIAGFGPGGVQYYRYSWDQTPTHSFTDTETQWSSGTLTKTSLVTGSWYLHVKSYNSEGASNGTVDYGPYYYDGVAPTGLANQAPLNGAVDQA